MRRTIFKIFGRLQGESGQGMAEYGLILFLIVIACIAVVTTTGGNIQAKIKAAASEIGSAAAK